MSYKSIEVHYDIASIPGLSCGNLSLALDFRNAAMELVEDALAEAELGDWLGAEIGAGEVNFGFEVTDFDAAEAVIRKAVADTPYANIRAIIRHEGGV